MEKHERRNEQPPVKQRSIELLIYGVFTAYDGDKGEYSTAWVELSDILMSIQRRGRGVQAGLVPRWACERAGCGAADAAAVAARRRSLA